MLTLNTLGPPRLLGPDGELLRGRRKELALLACLARRRPHPIARDELAELLWGNRPEANARQSLRQALVQLKRAVPTGFDSDGDTVTLSADAVQLDVTAFESDLAAGRLAEAVARWRGDFLAGVDDAGGPSFRAWLEAERESLRQRLYSALGELAERAERAGDRSGARSWLERWAELAPYDETAVSRLIRRLHADGELGEARGVHARFVSRLQRDLEVEPSDDFARLAMEVAEGPIRSRPTPASGAMFTPTLVGRDGPLVGLRRAWETAVAGTTSVVLVEGDEGMGKTRLCEEFVRTLPPAPDAVVLRCRASRTGQGDPFSTVRDLLEGIESAPGLAGAPPAALGAVGELIPRLRDRFPGAERGRSDASEAVADVLEAVAVEAPVLLLVDGYPHADAASRRLIRDLVRRLRRCAVCLVLTCRTDETPAELVADLRGLVGEMRIRLAPLSVAEVDGLLASMLEIAPDVRTGLVELLHRETAGNPHFLIETTALLLDEGRIAQDDYGRWRPVAPLSDALPVPASVREATHRRIASISPVARQMAEAAAVLAFPAPVHRLAQVAHLPAADADVALEELLLRRVFRTSARRTDEYEFAHDVVRRTVSEQLSRARRRQLHGAAWRAVRTAPADVDIPRAVVEYHRRRAGSRRGIALAGVLVLTLGMAAGWVLWPRAPLGFVERDWIVLADLENGTGDALFDQSLTAALSMAVSQSQHVNVYPPVRVRETLRRMRLDSNQTLTEPLAREVALREGLRAVVTLSIAADGSQFPLAARIVDPESGETVASVRAVARNESAILAALDQIGTDLRQTLGESIESIRRRSVSLPQASTSSLEALRRFAEGTRAIDAGRSADAVAALQAAITLDSNFAWAHAALGRYLEWINQVDAGEVHLNRALALVDRLPPREQLWVSRVIAQGRRDDVEAIRLSRAYVAQYPDDRDAWVVLGRSLQEAGDGPGALDAYRRVLEIDPHEGTALVNSAVLLDLDGRPHEAVAAFERAVEDDPSLVTQIVGDLNRIYGFALLRSGDSARARAVFRRVLEGNTGQQANGLRSLGLLEAYYGRYRAAISHFERAVELTSDSPVSELRNRVHLATALATVGDSLGLRNQLTAAYRVHRRAAIPVPFLTFLGWRLARAGRLGEAADVADTMTARMRPESAQERAAVELVRAEIALARNDPRAAAEGFGLAIREAEVSYPRQGLARAQVAMGRLDDAVATYRTMLRDSTLGWEGQEPWVLAHYELATLLDQRGDSAAAVPLYRKLAELWRTGDDEIPILRATRRRLAAVP